MHKKRVFCPYKRCHKVPPCHFDGMAFGLAFLTIGKLSPQGAWTFFSPLLVLSCWMSWSMTLPWMRTRSGFIFGGWFFFRWEKVTSIITKQLIHGFRCLATFFSYKCFILCESVYEEVPRTSIDIWKESTTSESHIMATKSNLKTG